jgi:Homeodomain-like domain
MDKIAQIHAEKSDETVREALAAYKANKLTSEQIAALYKICPATLTVWAKKAGFKLRTRGRRTLTQPTPRHLKILELAAHLRYDQIGAQFGMHKQQVHRIIKRWHSWTKPNGAPFKPGDILAWGKKRMTVIDAGATEGTLQDEKGLIYRHFTWAGPTVLKKIGVNPRRLVPAV